MQGVDLRSGGGHRSAKEKEVYAEEDHEGNVLWALRTEDMKLIGANADNPRGLPTRELFAIVRDPGEEHSLDLDRYDQQAEELENYADLHRRAAEGEAVAGGGEAEMSYEECEQLRMLGYVEDCEELR
jgi:hypothetical protein